MRFAHLILMVSATTTGTIVVLIPSMLAISHVTAGLS